MTNILRRKRKLVLETPFLVGRRSLIVHVVEPFGLRLRAKHSRHVLEITWAQIFNRAASIAAREERPEVS